MGGIIEDRVRAQVAPIANSLRGVSGSVYNNTVGLLPNSPSILGLVDVGALGDTASSALSSVTGAASGMASGMASGASAGASSLVSGLSGAASSAKRWVGYGGGYEPFAHIHLLQGDELDMFNNSKLGKYLKVIDKKLNNFFIKKYGDETILDKQAEEMLIFMEKASMIIVDKIIPYMAHIVAVSEPIEVEPGLRVALIKGAYGAPDKLVDKLVKRKSRKHKSKKRNAKTLRFR